MTATIELKNVKHAAFASEETECFEASVYIDGKRAGTVSNEGRGGCNRYEPYALAQTLQDIAANGPKLQLDIAGDGVMQEFDNDADTLVATILEKWLAARDLKKMLAGIALRLPTDAAGEFRTIKALKPTPENIARVAAKYPEAIILNALPQADALALYMGGAA